MTTAIRCSVLVLFYVLGLPAQPALAAKQPPPPPAAANDQAKGKPTPLPAAPAKTLRDAADEIGRRHGVRIVIDAAVRGDVPAPAVPAGSLQGMLLEATLRGLFAGNELMLHYGADRPNGAERLKAVWVFARAQGGAVRTTVRPDAVAAAAESEDPEERAAALHRLSSAAPAEAQATLSRGLEDSDENVRLQALHAELANASGVDLDSLRRLVEEDASEAVRMLALEAYLAHPAASDEALGSLLDRVAGDTQGMLADYARSVLEARAAVGTGTEVMPDPIEEHRE